MHDVDLLLLSLVSQLESAKPNPLLWSSSAARALHRQLEDIQNTFHALRSNLINLPVIGSL